MASQEPYRPIWADIDLGALRHNLEQIRSGVPPMTRVLAQVKSDAYGHGLIPVTRELAAAGVEYFGVVSLDEASALREAGITQPILVQSVLAPSNAEAVLALDVWPTICTTEFARALQHVARAREQRVSVHLKVDTGMGRLGVWHADAENFLQGLADCDALIWDGCYTHLPSADDDAAFTREQLGVFRACVDRVRRAGYPLTMVHAANSIGAVAFPESHLSVVRPGLMLYGLYPTDTMRTHVTLAPVLSWKSRIVFLKETPAGRTISYGRTHRTQQPTVIATVAAGYADGYRRALSGCSRVLVRGCSVPVVGRVCMDHLMVDVGAVPEVAAGDEVALIGCQGEARVTAEELAQAAGTIPYEIVTGIASRVPRFHLHALAPAPSDLSQAASL